MAAYDLTCSPQSQLQGVIYGERSNIVKTYTSDARAREVWLTIEGPGFSC
jgi:hypothetical protein